tara:strand:+ start:224 stop:781 length:558 start_codon:yes stop_codon:yes gene_type:complete
MITIKNTLVSEEIIEKDFTCNLSKCKGACCVEGESGAPLDEEELVFLENNYDKISPFLNENGRKEIEENGIYVKGFDGEWETPLVDGKECAYAVFSNGIVECGIENSFKDNKIKLQKPISCHLYPVRVKKYSEFTAVNYHQWKICSSACDLGNALKVPVYKFVKKALVRKFGLEWFKELSDYANK